MDSRSSLSHHTQEESLAVGQVAWCAKTIQRGDSTVGDLRIGQRMLCLHIGGNRKIGDTWMKRPAP